MKKYHARKNLLSWRSGKIKCMYSHLLVHIRKLLSKDEVDTGDLLEDRLDFSKVFVELLKLLGHHVHPLLRDVIVDQKEMFQNKTTLAFYMLCVCLLSVNIEMSILKHILSMIWRNWPRIRKMYSVTFWQV